MDNLVQNQYRNDSSRLPGWDYSTLGYYFMIIFTDQQQCYFGEVLNGKMQLNPLGKNAHRNWGNKNTDKSNIEGTARA